MKTKFLLQLLVLITATILFANTKINAQVTESEPNDVASAADSLPLNGSGAGSLSFAGDVDWWKVKTNADGDLTILLTGAPILRTVYIYDTAGTILLSQASIGSDIAGPNKTGLAPGTYFVKVICYYGWETGGNYTVSSSLAVAVKPNDKEPNNVFTKAIELPLNGSAKGHIGYYYNNRRDSADWYKVTTNGDGRLDITFNNTGNNDLINLILCDNDGATVLGSANVGNGIGGFSTDGLAAGTYYIRIKDYYGTNAYGPYTISDTLIETKWANDKEPNNQRSNAQKLVVNRSKTGHYGYYYNHQRDSSDWYKLTTTSDGMIKLILNNTGNQNLINLRLYDNDGATVLGNANVGNGIGGLSTDGLAAGIYYIRITDYYGTNAFGPYKITDSLILYNYAEEQEPDNRPYQANSLPVNSTVTGHVNFYYKNKKDTTDWYLLNYTNTTQKLSLTVNLSPSLINNTINAIHFDAYKDTLKPPVITKALFSQVNKFKLNHGKYYIKIYADNESSGYTAYSITNSGAATFDIMQNDLKIDDPGFDWNIYGSAAANNCSIQLKLNADASVSVQVISLTGNPVQHIQKGKLQKGSYSIPLNLNNAIAGIYVVNLVIDNQQYSKKIMK